jgi:hypothetical protein
VSDEWWDVEELDDEQDAAPDAAFAPLLDDDVLPYEGAYGRVIASIIFDPPIVLRAGETLTLDAGALHVTID